MSVLFTIGYAGKTAREFFGILQKAGIVRLIDIRESNTNIYAGFTMKQNLPYFLQMIAGIEYLEAKAFTPTKAIRHAYESDHDWQRLSRDYLALLRARQAETVFRAAELDRNVLLCSEAKAEECHRSLAAEFLRGIYQELKVVNL